MIVPKISFFRKYSIFYKAVIIGGILGLFYGMITDVGASYEHLGFLPSIVIGISIGFIVIVFEKRLINLNNYPFVIAMLLKALIYSFSILIFLILFVVVFPDRTDISTQS
ncbi:hypothetical protein GKZ90_0025620 [Flavobacterium sp. MC2016-06]|jgi:adenylate cyclase|uniref:hypothetical protein n=1 Tax=Flavobacterium sp. MC2016-06 TaxID=2676308 RepID=UPI0031D46DBA